MKKVAMISAHACPLVSMEGGETGGLNIYVLELSRELAKKGWKIDVFTRLQNINQKKVVQISENFRVIHIEGGPIRFIPTKDIINYIEPFSKSLNTFSNENYDLIHAHYYSSAIAGASFAKNTGCPLIFNFHTLGLMKNLVARNDFERENQKRIVLEREIVKNVDKIISSSQSEKEYLQYLYNAPDKKIEIITPGVDTNLFKPIDKTIAKEKIGAELSHKIILFVGRIEPLKGIDVLIYALKIALTKNPKLGNVCLWIVGGKAYSMELQRLMELVEELDMETTVKFVGQKSHQDLPFYLNAAEMVVIPSHYESFGMSVLESMACGTPVITTNVAGISGILDKHHQNLITSSNNPLKLALQIEDLLMGKNNHEKISKNLLRHAKEFVWSNAAEKTIRIYKKLILKR